MSELLPMQCEPVEAPQDWDYDKSVRMVKAKVYKAKNLTVQILQELWVAREILSAEPALRQRQASGTFVPMDKTWSDYCRDIDVERRTANRWLKALTQKAITTANRNKPKVAHEDVVYSLDDLLDQGIRFQTVYADPPWGYGNQATRAATNNHYKTMTIEQICDLPVEQLAEDNAHLHLWTTNAFLFEAKQVMEAWGFEYKSVLLWVKPQLGIGNYWRVCHEFLLFGLRGKLAMREARKKKLSWVQHDRLRHSMKPAEFRKLVEDVSYPERLEMFGREAHEGWWVYGDEIVGAEMFHGRTSTKVSTI